MQDYINLDTNNISQFIISEMGKQNLSNYKLAFLIGIDPSQVSRYARGKIQPNLPMAGRILTALGYSIYIK